MLIHFLQGSLQGFALLLTLNINATRTQNFTTGGRQHNHVAFKEFLRTGGVANLGDMCGRGEFWGDPISMLLLPMAGGYRK